MDKQQPDCALEPAEVSQPAITQTEPQPKSGLTSKEAWWAGYRAGKGLPPDMPRQEALAAPAITQASNWISAEQEVPKDGEQVIVTSQGWGSPQVLEYNETPWPRFLDRYEGRWYWYPERMHWMRFPPVPFDSARMRDEVAKGAGTRSQNGVDGQ